MSKKTEIKKKMISLKEAIDKDPKIWDDFWKKDGASRQVKSWFKKTVLEKPDIGKAHERLTQLFKDYNIK